MDNQPQFKFFIVDEDVFSANMYKQYLMNMSFTDITYYTNTRDCIDNLHQNPDIILLYHNLGDINGFKVLKKIKEYNSGIYVIIISGEENTKTTVDALRFGAFDYVIKGNDIYEKMNLIIKKIITVKEQLKAIYPGFIKRLLSIF